MIVRAGLLVAVLLSSAAHAGPTTGLDRARWSLARGDTLTAIAHLDSAVGPITRAVLLRLRLDPDATPPPHLDGRAANWARVLRFGDTGPFAEPASTAELALVRAARALDATDPATAREILDGTDVPDRLRTLALHLRARALASTNDPAVRAVREELAARDHDTDFDRRVIDEAAFALGLGALERGEDPSTWFDRIDTEGPLAPWVALVVALRGDDDLLGHWLDAHPAHPARFETRLHHAARALDEGDDATARSRYLELERDLDARTDSLAAIAADSTRFRDWASRRWAAATSRTLRIDAATRNRALESLDHALREPERDLPRPETWLRVVAAVPTSIDPPSLSQSALRRDRALADSIDVAARTVHRARHRLQVVTREVSRRDAYRARGMEDLEELRTRLDDASAALQGLDAEIPANLAALRALEDSLLARLDARTDALAARATAQARRARTLARWYGRGPMARRDLPADPRVPVPADHLDAEAAWADTTRGTVERFATVTRRRVRRSFSEVFARRLDTGVEEQRMRGDSLRDRAERAVRSIDATREALRTHPDLVAARAAVDSARARHDAWTGRRDALRVTAARRLLADLRAREGRRREAVAYGAAVATTEAARSGHPHLRDEARERWATFVEGGCDPAVRGDARYRWADLELAAARADFRHRMRDWLDADDTADRALAPLLDVDGALAVFSSILEEDPTFARRDLVLLHLGLLHADRGDPRATRHLTRLVEDFPDSPVVDVAELRRGEIAFERGDHDAALPSLRAASRSSDPEIRAVALYQRGWSAHVTARGAEAVDSFRSLLDLYDGPDAPSAFDLGTEARELYLRALARAGGAPAFAAAVERNGTRDDDPTLLTDLSELLSEYALYARAAAVDHLLLRRHPLDPAALDAARRWITNTEGTNEDDVLDVAARFGPDGAWSVAQVDTSLRTEASDFARDVFVDTAARRHRAAREAGDDTTKWKEARALHERTARTWPDDPRATQWWTLAGECDLALGDHAAAIEDFVTAARDRSDHGDDAAWRAVATADTWYRTTLVEGVTAGPDSVARRFLALADSFRDRISDPERAADLDWRTLSVEATHDGEERVVARARVFVERHPDDPRAVGAARLGAEALYRGGSYERAADAFEAAATRAHAAGRDSLARELEDWAPHAFELHTEGVEADTTRGPARAAHLWRRLAVRWPESEHAARALYRAGTAHATAGHDSLAVDAWSTLIDSRPGSDLVADAYRNVARTHEDVGDLAAAARTLVAYADAFPRSGDAADAWLHAVDLHERRGDRVRSEALLDDYLQRHPEDLRTRRAVRERRARDELADGDRGEAVDTYLAFAHEHPDHASDEVLAAIAFHRADAGWEGFAAVELTQPLTESIPRKRDRLQDLIEAYRDVIEREVAPWTQAATQRLGEALLHMGDAIVQSERPTGLQGDDRLAYDEVLEEQAWTFHERGESTLRELLRHHDPDAAPRTAVWATRARDTLFPRIARRFLHQPSFDYPVIDDTTADLHEATSSAIDRTRNDSRIEASDLLTEDR